MVGLADICGWIAARQPDTREPTPGAYAQAPLDVGGLPVAIQTSDGELPVIRDINFSVTPGECVGIVGD
jgi:ABC-type protease/lipase transport system fused ATPase/permease subunit